MGIDPDQFFKTLTETYGYKLRASPTVPFKKNQMTLFERLASSEVIRAKTLLQRTIQIGSMVFKWLGTRGKFA
jgi:hypothetical protein